MNRYRIVAVLLAWLVWTAPAFAAATWVFGTQASPDCTSDGTFRGNTWSCANAGEGTLAATAWSTTGSSSTYQTAELNQYSTSGFGVRNRNETQSSPDHSMDNSGAKDLILLHFTDAVNLTSLKLGWVQNDSDLSVLAFTGSANASAPPNLAGKTASSLLTANGGWSLVGNYANVGASSLSIASPVASSWWIVSAYNSSFDPYNTVIGTAMDYVKLLSVSGMSMEYSVPEPASLALAGLALAALWGTRRRAGRGCGAQHDAADQPRIRSRVCHE